MNAQEIALGAACMLVSPLPCVWIRRIVDSEIADSWTAAARKLYVFCFAALLVVATFGGGLVLILIGIGALDQSPTILRITVPETLPEAPIRETPRM